VLERTAELIPPICDLRSRTLACPRYGLESSPPSSPSSNPASPGIALEASSCPSTYCDTCPRG
jgi:hypothetical protein